MVHVDPRALVGQTLDDGRIRIEGLLGEGSFAVVYNGREVDSGEQVAVKCLFKSGMAADQLDAQMREAEFLRELDWHPHVVQLKRVVESDDHFCLVMEKCDGDLFDAIMQRQGYPEPDARRLFGQLASAVAAAHSRGIFHRDVKPENVFLKNGAVKLGDFGLATFDALSSEYGCGSVRYMAPEVHFAVPRRRAISAGFGAYAAGAGDVWALGVILINLLTAKNPWVEPSSRDRHFYCHLLSSTKGDSFQSQFNFSIEFCMLLRRIFDLDPSNRPSAHQLVPLLDEIPSLFKQTICISPKHLPPLSLPNGHMFPQTIQQSPHKSPLQTHHKKHDDQDDLFFHFETNNPAPVTQPQSLLPFAKKTNRRRVPIHPFHKPAPIDPSVSAIVSSINGNALCLDSSPISPMEILASAAEAASINAAVANPTAVTKNVHMLSPSEQSIIKPSAKHIATNAAVRERPPTILINSQTVHPQIATSPNLHQPSTLQSRTSRRRRRLSRPEPYPSQVINTSPLSRPEDPIHFSPLLQLESMQLPSQAIQTSPIIQADFGSNSDPSSVIATSIVSASKTLEPPSPLFISPPPIPSSKSINSSPESNLSADPCSPLPSSDTVNTDIHHACIAPSDPDSDTHEQPDILQNAIHGLRSILFEMSDPERLAFEHSGVLDPMMQI